MQPSKNSASKARREYSQLLRLQERLLTQLQRVRDELQAPGTVSLVKEIRRRTGNAPALSEVTSAVEEAIRNLKVHTSEAQGALLEEPGGLEVDGAPNLPATLARFLAERQQFPGFSYQVSQDEVRGWVIRWKEHTAAGTVRGCGQFYERPYAWLED
jgi:hypothetical protein